MFELKEKYHSRLRVAVRGAVQGVGFRPFIYRLATSLELYGWVLNSPQGVFIEVEGADENLKAFLLSLDRDKPARAIIQSMEFSFLDSVGFNSFVIRGSEVSGEKSALVLPDISTCEECTREIFDPADRRFLYPFTNCTNCGPRFTIMGALPYDRPNTSMNAFALCAQCYQEYDEPIDRRFHAQPNACPVCGPALELWTGEGKVNVKGRNALLEAAGAVRDGRILALKGLGGFHLIVDAGNEGAVLRLRDRKGREQKPFALMFPSLDFIRKYCEVSSLEERVLLSPESPIVLLKSKDKEFCLSPTVAPNNPYLGVMLPYTPLHHILMQELGFPVVATSGNLTDEPIVTDEREALTRLAGIADLLLVHDRPIMRHVDDSIVRISLGRELVLRRARGYAPLPIQCRVCVNPSLPKILAVGAHLKNTVSISLEDNVFISQHIGDLETEEAHSAFRRIIEDFKKLYEFEPEVIACDMHPDYLSTKYAKGMDLPVIEVQHHHAHVAACMAENELEGPVLGISWDGTGYGMDGTVWGGEFLMADYVSFKRVCHFKPFRLPGGEKAVREPRRSALGVLFELFGEEALEKTHIPLLRDFREEELKILGKMIMRGINSPLTSSVGRMFDAVASIIDSRQLVSFEGQAAMELEYLVRDGIESHYPLQIVEESEPGPSMPGSPSSYVVDWTQMILGILKEVGKGVSKEVIATKFHNTLSEVVVGAANIFGLSKIVLSGGVFQNRYLTERTWQRLEEEGFKPYAHQRVPPNDGGISLGQVVVAAARYEMQDA
jgi:hydrogenase maturation protein HypF